MLGFLSSNRSTDQPGAGVLARGRLRKAWRELTFADTEQSAKATRDPVAPAKRSASAQSKVDTHVLLDCTPVHSFTTLMANMTTIVRNTCRALGADSSAHTFEITTTPNPQQRRAFALIDNITV